MAPKVCIVMAVYHKDNAKAFSIAVTSILSQTYRNIDLFICVDGPVGSALHIVLQHLRELPNVYVFQKSTSAGLAKALNFLIEKAVASRDYYYIARMDSDDICSLGRIEAQVHFMEQNRHVGVLGTGCVEFNSEGLSREKIPPLIDTVIKRRLIFSCPLIHPSVMFRLSVFETGIRYPVNTRLSEDIGLWLELKRSGFVFSNLPMIGLHYRLNDSTIRRRLGFMKGISECKVRLRYWDFENINSILYLFFILVRPLVHLLPFTGYKIVRSVFFKLFY